MKYAFIFVTAITGFAVAGPISSEGLKQSLLSTGYLTRNSALEQLILELCEDLRELMLTGSDDVPILDPLHVDSLELDDQIIPVPGAKIDLKDLTVRDMSTFEISSLSVTRESLLLQRYRVEMDLIIPALDITADGYDLFISVLGVNIFGNGDMKIKIVEPKVIAVLTVAPRFTIGGIYLNVLDCTINFNLKSFEPTLTGMLNDEAASVFISSFLSNLIPELLYFFEPEVTEVLSSTVKDVANDVLSDLNLISILG